MTILVIRGKLRIEINKLKAVLRGENEFQKEVSLPEKFKRLPYRRNKLDSPLKVIKVYCP